MAYCTQTDILEELDQSILIQLTDDLTTPTGAVDESRVIRAIAHSDALIDSYCGKRHTVPLSPVPEVIQAASVTMSIHRMYSLRRGAPESRQKDYEAVIKWLEGVRDGKNSLGEDDPEGVPASSHEVDIDGPDRVFSRDNLEGF